MALWQDPPQTAIYRPTWEGGKEKTLGRRLFLYEDPIMTQENADVRNIRKVTMLYC